MKLILQNGGQSIEYEFVNREGVPLTNAQSSYAIDKAYRQWIGDAYDASATTPQKASFLLEMMADHMMNAAKRQRRSELQKNNEDQILTEFG